MPHLFQVGLALDQFFPNIAGIFSVWGSVDKALFAFLLLAKEAGKIEVDLFQLER